MSFIYYRDRYGGSENDKFFRLHQVLPSKQVASLKEKILSIMKTMQLKAVRRILPSLCLDCNYNDEGHHCYITYNLIILILD